MNTKTTLFSKISNYIFIFSLILIIGFIWINYYTHKMLYSLYIALSITSVCIITTLPIIATINRKHHKSIDERTQKDNIKNQFIYGNLQYNISYLLALFNISTIKQIDACHYVDSDDKDILFLLDKDKPLDNHIKYCNNRNIVIFTIDQNINYIYQNHDITIYNYDIIYKKIVEINSPPNITIDSLKTHKYRYKDILCIALNKNNAKQYLHLGLLTLFLSLFTLFPIYYIIIGTFLLLLSVIARYNHSYNKSGM